MSKKILFIIDDIELKYFEFNDLVTNFWFIKEFLKKNCSPGDLLITMGAGDVVNVGEMYLND